MIYAIRQTISATNQFDATLPDNGFSDYKGVRTYVTDTNGGLFQFPFNVPVSVTGIHFYVGLGADVWTVSIGDSGGDLVVAEGESEDASYVLLPPQELILLPGQTLKFFTSEASEAMAANVFFGSSHNVPWIDKV